MRKKKLFKSRKGLFVWVSWVILVTFVIFLGTLVFYWMEDYAKTSSEDLKTRADTAEKCNFIAISISELVEKNPQTLNMKVTNRYNLRVDQIVFRVYDNNNNVLTQTVNVTIKPNSTKAVEISKNSSQGTARLEAIPALFEDGRRIVCNDRIAEAEIE